MAGREFIENLRAGEPLLFSWLMMPGAFQAEMIARAGYGGSLIDMQHGLIGFQAMVEMVQAIRRADKPAFVRVPISDFSMVSRALDAGASAVVCPMINSARDAEMLVKAAKFQPLGERSWGPFYAMSTSGMSAEEYLGEANGRSAVLAMIETRDALDNLREICRTPGLDGVFVGPYDLSISLSGGTVAGATLPAVREALPKIVAEADAAGIVAGVYASDAGQAKEYAELGFRFISAANDFKLIAAGMAALSGCGGTV